MFDKLSQREKILVIATGGSLLVALIFGGFFWFLGKYNANETRLRGIASQIEREEARTRRALAATRRKAWYAGTSLTSDVDDAKNQYIAWLKKTLRDEIGVDLKGVDPERTTELSHEGVKVADQISFSIRPSMKLSQLVRFFETFYSIDTLHRISSFKLTPQTETVRGKKVRTGALKTSFQIEVLCLTSAGRKSGFGDAYRDAGLTIDQARDAIVRRDIFGPANSSPLLKAKTRSSYESGGAVTIQLTATDADEDDQLTIALTESSVDSATFEQIDGTRKATLKIPGQEQGSYQFKFTVSDNGLPPRSTNETVTVRFKDKAVRVVKEVPKLPPVPLAEETRITGNLKNRDGEWVVLIKSQMDGKSFRLMEGQTFEMDDKTWRVMSITKTSATLAVAGEALTFNRGTPFSKPTSRTPAPE